MIKAINIKNIKALIKNLAISIGVGVLSTLLAGNQDEFFSILEKPFFAPPPIVFGIVWPVLYVLIAIAAYFVETSKAYKNDVKRALWWYYINLFFNFMWPIIFFRWRLIGVAAIWIIGVLITSLVTAYEFWKVEKKSFYLFLPYVLWIVFATVLNISIWILNM